MTGHQTFTRWALATSVVLASAVAAWAAPPSNYNKNDAVFKAGKLEKGAEALFTQYNHFKEQGTLEKSSNGTVRHIEVTSAMAGQLRNVIDAYFQAVEDGWPESDPQLVEVKAKVEAMRKKMEACGMWMSFAFGEKPMPEGRSLDNLRDRAWYATILVKGGEVDKGVEQFKDIDVDIERMHKAVERALDQGDTKRVTVKLKEHPAYLRTIAEIERFKKEAAPAMTKVTAGRDNVDKDAKTILDLRAKFEEPFRQVADILTARQSDERAKQYEQFLPKLKTLETDAAAAKTFLKDFSAKYGSNSMDIDNTMAKLLNAPLKYDRDPGTAYRDLDEGFKKMDEVRPAVAKVLLEEAQDAIKNFRQYNEQKQEAFFALQKQRLELAAGYDPANAALADTLKNLDATRKGIIDKINKEIDAEQWDPKPSKKFQGPGSADALADSAIAWFKNSEWMNQYSLVALRVAGDWHAAEKNALGMQINWGLPVEVALYSHEDRKAGRDVVKSFWMSMYTHDLKQGPPWKIAAVGDNRWMRSGAFKGAALTDLSSVVAGSTGGRAGTAGSNAPFILFRLVLSLALISLGVLVATPLIVRYVPAAASLLGKLAAHKAVLGVVALAAGVVLLLWNLVRLRPHADLLPQALAIVTGLVLAAEFLATKRLAGAENLLIRHQGTIKTLEKYQMPLGAACIVLGLMHLLFAGAALL
ncbi:MAG: hypothetical protein ABFD92_01370 [Planctomycetaceae bacterium]|nr:hypothetical protein [Planctomycetaceae bacterium]